MTIIGNGSRDFRTALLDWWRTLWAQANEKLNEILELSSDLERGRRAQRLFSDVAYSSNEWRRVLSVIAADSRLSEQIGQQVGTTIFRGVVLTAEQIAQPFIDEGMVALFATHDEHDEPDPDAIFAKVFPNVEAYLASTNVNYEVSIPLVGLASETSEIILDEKTIIAQRSDQWDPFRLEIDRILRDAGDRSLLDDELADPPHYRTVLRIRYSFPKLIGSVGSTEEARREFYEDVELRVRDCLRSLATVVFLSIVVWPPYVRELGILPRYDRGLRVLRPQNITYFATAGGTITEGLVDPLVKAWERLRHPDFATHESNRAIGVALDRLGALGSKSHSKSDQLVDTVIACEAFFTLGHAGYRQELGFRAAMTAAYLSPLINTGFAKDVVFRLIDKAYNARSRIVHGDRLRERDLSFEGASWSASIGEDDALWNFIFYTAELVRRGIYMKLLETAPGEAVTINWDSIFFRDG